MNLSTLRDQVKLFVRRPDLTSAEIDGLIGLAEARLNSVLFIRERESSDTLTATTASNSLALPIDFFRVRSLKVLRGSHYVELDLVSEAEIDKGATGSPKAYSVGASEIRLSPMPDDTYTLPLIYWTVIPALSDSSPTNWLLNRAPNIYLFAVCAEAESYVMNDERVRVWNEKLTEAVSNLERAEWNAGASMRARTSAMVV